MTTVSPTTWYSFPAQDTHTTEVLKNNMSGEKLKKGKNGAQSKKKDPIELDHLHEHDISFWGKWRGDNMLCGIMLHVGRDARSKTRTIKKVEYLERQPDGTYFNVDNNTRSRDLAQAAANQAFISQAISGGEGIVAANKVIIRGGGKDVIVAAPTNSISTNQC